MAKKLFFFSNGSMELFDNTFVWSKSGPNTINVFSLSECAGIKDMITRESINNGYEWKVELHDAKLYIKDSTEREWSWVYQAKTDSFVDIELPKVNELYLNWPAVSVNFGSYEQDNIFADGKEPIEWIIYARNSTQMLLVSKYILDVKQYDDENAYDLRLSWENSDLRKWLNNEFYSESFTDKEKDAIVKVRYPTVVYKGDVFVYDYDRTEMTDDNVFLPDYDMYLENVLVTEYAESIEIPVDRYGGSIGVAHDYWLGGMWIGDDMYSDFYQPFVLDVFEERAHTHARFYYGVRPAILVDANLMN